MVMQAWLEFRTHILPWLVAAAVVGLMAAQERQRTLTLNGALVRQAQAIEAQNNLLATQGYLVPPMQEPRSEFGAFGSP
jgi:hypothetical protein